MEDWSYKVYIVSSSDEPKALFTSENDAKDYAGRKGFSIEIIDVEDIYEFF